MPHLNGWNVNFLFQALFPNVSGKTGLTVICQYPWLAIYSDQTHVCIFVLNAIIHLTPSYPHPPANNSIWFLQYLELDMLTILKLSIYTQKQNTVLAHR